MNAPPRIVLIDDNREWLEGLAEFLRRKGFVVQTASHPDQGLSLAVHSPVTMVLCDYHLPDMDGLQVLRRLRQFQNDVMVVLLSSDDEPDVEARALREGARAFVSKTTAPGALLRTLRQILDGPRPLPSWQRLLPGPKRPPRRRPRKGRPAA